jgi:hypothetical protein
VDNEKASREAYGTIIRNSRIKPRILKMLLKTFRKLSEYNSYFTDNVRDVYQIDLMSLSRIYYFFRYVNPNVKRRKGPGFS